MALMNSTLTTVRQNFLEYMGYRHRGTTSGAGVVGGTTVVDSTLAVYANDFFNGWWIKVTSGTYSGQERHISDFVSSGGTLTVDAAFGGQIGASVTYELSPWHFTNEVLFAINEGLHVAYPDLKRDILNYDLVTGNALPPTEDYIASTTIPDHWALVGAAATSAKETTIKRYDLSAMKLTRAGTDCYIHCSDTQWPPLLNLGGESPYIECWAYATVASRARLGLSVNAATPTYSGYHTGGSTWELLRKQITIADSPDSLSFRCLVDTGDTAAYFDAPRILSGNVAVYIVPKVFKQNPPGRVSVQVTGTSHGNESPCDDQREIADFKPWPWVKFNYDYDLGAWLMSMEQKPAVGYKIKLEGQEVITDLSAETDTVPLNTPQLSLLDRAIAHFLYQRLADLGVDADRNRQKAADKWTNYMWLKQRLGQKDMTTMVNYGKWDL